MEKILNFPPHVILHLMISQNKPSKNFHTHTVATCVGFVNKVHKLQPHNRSTVHSKIISINSSFKNNFFTVLFIASSGLRNSNFTIKTPNLSIIIFYILMYVFRSKVIYKRHNYENGIKTQIVTLTIHKMVSVRIFIIYLSTNIL